MGLNQYGVSNGFLTGNNGKSTYFPLTGNQLDFPLTGNDFPLTGNDFPLTGIQMDFPLTRNDFPLTEIRFPVNGKSARGKWFPVNGKWLIPA